MFSLKTNQIVTPSQLADLFQVKTLKQSRFIKETNTLVLISDYTKGDRPNKWIGDTLHLTGNQKITGSTYSKLADSRTNGVTIHLFQVMNPKEYTYSGSYLMNVGLDFNIWWSLSSKIIVMKKV